jgi:hypothetical protein
MLNHLAHACGLRRDDGDGRHDVLARQADDNPDTAARALLRERRRRNEGLPSVTRSLGALASQP